MSSGADAAQQQRNQALAVLLLATIGLTFIGLLSVAGFTVMAQRRLRALGMIGAIGATDRQVRRVMLANGAAVGTVGAIVGVGARPGGVVRADPGVRAASSGTATTRSRCRGGRCSPARSWRS